MKKNIDPICLSITNCLRHYKQTKTAMCLALNFPRTTFDRKFKNPEKFTAYEIERMSKFFGVRMDDFVNGRCFPR